MAKKSNKKQLTLGHVKSSTTTVSTTPAIKDISTSANQGIILINQATIQKIYENSGTLAKANEFQTHYWALNFRHKAEDGSILDISVPTVYFNYKQEVSSASIDFDLKDVKEYSEKLKPVHHMKVNQLLQTSFKESLESILGISLEMIHSDVNSIHRHPGSSTSQSFSGTDLTKSATEPGVVYPLASGTETANFAGIMAIDSGINHVAHYEYRIASGTLGTDIEYTKGRCAAIIVDADRPVSTIEKLMGVSSTSSYAKYDDCSNSPIINSIHQLARTLYLDNKFEAFTDSVVDNHITARAVFYGNYYNSYRYADTSPYTSKYIDYPYRYYSEESLLTMPVMNLNDLYKALTYEDVGSVMSATWVPTADKVTKLILDLQGKLGYTKDKPYGKHSVRDILKTEDEYKSMYAYELREEFIKVADYYNYSYDKASIVAIYDKALFLVLLEKVRNHYLKEVKPKHPQSSSSLPQVDGIRPRADLKPDQILDLEDALDTIVKYSDFKMMDTSNISSKTPFQLHSHLETAEELYYGYDLEGEIYAGSKDDYAMQINFVQQLIQSEIEEAVNTIKELSIDEEVVKELTKSEETTDISLEFMREALSLYSVDQTILKSLSYEKTKEMYEKVVQYH